jgi:hypothetical protein
VVRNLSLSSDDIGEHALLWQGATFCNKVSTCNQTRNPLIPIVCFDIQTAFHAHMSIFESVISGSACNALWRTKCRTFSLGENLLRNVVKKVDNAKTYATISGRTDTKWSLVCLVWYLFVNFKTQIDASVVIFALLRFSDSMISFCNNFMPPKRRFWMSERTFGIEFSNYFSKERGPNRVLTPLKSTSKTSSQTFVGLPKSSFGEHKFHASQTKILKAEQKIGWVFSRCFSRMWVLDLGN